MWKVYLNYYQKETMGRKTLEKKQKEFEEKQKVKAILLNETKRIISKKSVAPTPLIEDISDYRQYFLRSEKDFSLKTKSKERAKQIKELVRHVFNKYTVPDFLYNVWTENSNNLIRKQFDFKKWYICIANGGSLYKEITKEHLTKKETHIFLNCAHKVNIEEALLYAVAKCEGANDGIALRIARSKINEHTLSEYWKQNIRWFAKNTPESIAQINDLVDFLISKKQESPTFSLMGSGFTLPSLMKKMHDWHYDLRRLKAIGEASWEGHAINNETYTFTDQHKVEYTWHFYQIKSAKELQQEGNAQRHCVLSYKSRCINGSCSIWSLKLGLINDTFNQAKRKITIELNNNGTIVQARGLANRGLKNDEKAIIQRWAKENGLSMRGYL